MDFLRGLAVIGMIVFHAFFVLTFLGDLDLRMNEGWWLYFADVVRFIFLSLVGVGMVISYENVRKKGGGYFDGIFRQWKRGAAILIVAFLVNIATYFFVPDQYVRFGILHLIAFSIFVLSFLLGRKYLALLFSVFSFVFAYYLRDLDLDFLLLKSDSMVSLDYFPLFPWMGIVSLGIFFAYIFYGNGKSKFNFPFLKSDYLKPIYWLGKKALPVYLLHVPLIILIFWLLGLISLQSI